MYFQRVREKIQQFVFQSDKIQRDIQQTVLKIKIFFESERMLVNTGNCSLLSKHFLQSSKTSPKPTQTIFTLYCPPKFPTTNFSDFITKLKRLTYEQNSYTTFERIWVFGRLSVYARYYFTCSFVLFLLVFVW